MMENNDKMDCIIERYNEVRQTDNRRLYRQIQEKTLRRRLKNRRRRILRTCAAVVLPVALASGVWLYLQNNIDSDRNAITRVTEDVRLTLPDGSEIVLDKSNANSRIAQQDNVAIIYQDGRLVNERQPDVAAVGAEQQWGTLEIPNGSQFDIVLEDGTHVWLNASSRLRFPVGFSNNERRVYLEGEGYFSVTHDESIPFIVETAEQTLTVFGTEFNIYAYSGEQKVLTTLVSGSVGVAAKGSDDQKVLVPGQQLQFDNSTKLFSVRTVDAEDVVSWRNGRFVFNDNTLDEVMIKLSRWYNFEYDYEDDSLKGLLIKGSLPIYDDMSRVLNLIESMDKAAFERKGNVVKVKKR